MNVFSWCACNLHVNCTSFLLVVTPVKWLHLLNPYVNHESSKLIELVTGTGRFCSNHLVCMFETKTKSLAIFTSDSEQITSFLPVSQRSIFVQCCVALIFLKFDHLARASGNAQDHPLMRLFTCEKLCSGQILIGL